MNKEDVIKIVYLLKKGESLTGIARSTNTNVMYVSVIRKLMVMDLLTVKK